MPQISSKSSSTMQPVWGLVSDSLSCAELQKMEILITKESSANLDEPYYAQVEE